MSSALALAACGGGGLSSTSTSSRASVLGVCTINQTCGTTTGGTATPAVPDSDGDGTPDDTDTNGGVGSGAGGNTTGLTTGNRTIAIRSSNNDTTAAGVTALSQLSSLTSPTHSATEAAILSGTKPKSLKIEVDTKTTTNSQWAIPIEQNEHVAGTRDTTWLNQDWSHVNTPATAMVLTDHNGNPLTFDPQRQTFVYSVTHNYGGETFNRDTVVDLSETYYWNQLKPYLGSKANGGAKDNYTEYRAVDRSPTVNRDEVLQVWAWQGNNSYTTHYGIRDGEEWSKHAWSYGGNAATTMPTSGTATYNGRFVGTAKTSNWIKLKGADIDPNAVWRVQGRSQLQANFGTNDIRGTLSTESWTSFQDARDGYYTWFTQEAANTTAGNIAGTPTTATPLEPNYYDIYDAKVILEGKLSAPTTGAALSNFEGTATLNNDFISSNNPLYGGFFGAESAPGVRNGTEATGIFSVSGQTVDPIGGSSGLIGNRAGFLDMNGSFNAACATVTPTGPCVVAP